MSTPTYRWHDSESSPPGHRLPQRWETALFGFGLLLSLAILCFFAYRVVSWQELAERGARTNTLYVVGATALASVALFSSCRWCSLLLLAFAARCRQYRRLPPAPATWPFVSIFVPSYNESATIASALRSLIELDYPAYEVIVVNDGSADDTLQQARVFEGRHGRCVVRVYDKPNGGKWSAHNLAFQRSTGELILCIDADSRLDPQSLRTLVARMSDPHIAGIAGQMRVRNRSGLLTRLQALEYLIANGAVRTGQGLFGTVLIVPGPIGMFRRSVLEEVWLRYTSGQDASKPGAVDGPFEGDTFAEDFDLSLAIHCLGGRIVYEPGAISFTKSPETIFALVNQRYRWTRGAIQVLRKFARRARQDPSLLSPRLLGWLVATCVLDLTILPLLYCLGLSFSLVVISAGGNLPLLAAMFGAFLMVHISAGAFFVSMHDDRLELLHVLPAYSLYTGMLLNSAWAISVVDELRGQSMRW
jgi:cellulose synthase/poly-beta-1,6-N-acetylglucosamine synthase-like glycosyltransferase